MIVSLFAGIPVFKMILLPRSVHAGPSAANIAVYGGRYFLRMTFL